MKGYFAEKEKKVEIAQKEEGDLFELAKSSNSKSNPIEYAVYLLKALSFYFICFVILISFYN